MAFGFDDAITIGTAVLPYLFGNKTAKPTDFEKNIQAQIQKIINSGGVGLSDKQLAERGRFLQDQNKPAWNAVLNKADMDAAGRGIFNSGVAFDKKLDIYKNQATNNANIMAEMDWNNQQAKLNSLMSALGLGANVAQTYGNLERSSQAANQGSNNALWSVLASAMGKKLGAQFSDGGSLFDWGGSDKRGNAVGGLTFDNKSVQRFLQ